MSDFSLTLVLQIKTSKIINDMAKVPRFKDKNPKAAYALGFYLNQNSIGPQPMQLVVLMAVRNAVSAATSTFTAISVMLFLFIRLFVRLLTPSFVISSVPLLVISSPPSLSSRLSVAHGEIFTASEEISWTSQAAKPSARLRSR